MALQIASPNAGPAVQRSPEARKSLPPHLRGPTSSLMSEPTSARSRDICFAALEYLKFKKKPKNPYLDDKDIAELKIKCSTLQGRSGNVVDGEEKFFSPPGIPFVNNLVEKHQLHKYPGLEYLGDDNFYGARLTYLFFERWLELSEETRQCEQQGKPPPEKRLLESYGWTPCM